MFAYFHHVTKRLDLRKDMSFNMRCQSARWNTAMSRWILFVDGQACATANYLAPATGYTGRKYVPKLIGLARFKHAYHTSEFPADLELDEKRVAVIGTGASGMQTIETIAPKVKHLTVFQRTPNLATPRFQEHLTLNASVAERASYASRYANMSRTTSGMEMSPINRFTFDDDPVTRWETYERLWRKGGQHFWFGNYKDMLTSRKANREAYAFWRSKAGPRIEDPRMRAMLCPSHPPHAFGAKRPALEEKYFEAFNQQNVDLVDLHSDSIEEITEHGIRMTSGSFIELDVIVIATGYDSAIGSQLAIDIRGAGGQSLSEKWLSTSNSRDPLDSRCRTHLGLMTHGFPNLIFPAGPQAPSAFGITPRLAELQGDWIVDMLVYAQKNGFKTFQVAKEAELWWKEECNKAVEKTLIAQTDGWYMGNNVPGRKKETLFYFGGMNEYVRICECIRELGYLGFDMK